MRKNAMEELIQEYIDATRLIVLEVGAKLEQALFEIYKEMVLDGYLSEQMFLDIIQEEFGKTTVDGFKITIEEDSDDRQRVSNP